MGPVDEAAQGVRGAHLSTSSTARVRDYALGETDRCDVDREVYDHSKKVVPHQDDGGVAGRRRLERVVRNVIRSSDIDQVNDPVNGLPTQRNTHEVAQRLDAGVAVASRDNDPVCVARGREPYAGEAHTHLFDLDATRPAESTDNPEVHGYLDPTHPLPLMRCGTSHHVEGDQDPVRTRRPEEHLVIGGVGRTP